MVGRREASRSALKGSGHRFARPESSRLPTTSMTCASQPDRRHQTAPFRFARHKESRPDCRAGRFQLQT
ncbi:MAG: glycerate kinase, partial [Gammaproteobacteria bacterium HGW-Gammaproteobacteria-5]